MNVQVFRDGKRALDVDSRLRALAAAAHDGDVLDTLLRAGELESALEDAGDHAAPDAARWADAAADALITSAPLAAPPLPRPERRIAHASAPEGFAYYALHPLEYALAARDAVPDAPRRVVIVLGIRTIGATLSAVVAASLRARGHTVHRATIRPSGHPFDRRARLSYRTGTIARDVAEQGGLALIADEGPGLSGSSFLAAADALCAAGFPRERIILLPSHAADPERLCAPDASSRWRALRSVVASSTSIAPEGARVELSAGEWRSCLLDPRAAWPETWPAMERRKFLAEDGSVMKFEGLGCFGEAARARADALATLGIAPASRALAGGYLLWERAPGRPLTHGDAPPLDSIARAIAARLELETPCSAEPSVLEDATRANVRALLGRDLPRAFSLPVARPAIVDGHLAPHEWIADARGGVRKIDAVSHGDDHFLPGPCDIAWDLAGAIVEWRLDDAVASAMLDRYVALSGDRAVRARLGPWRIAYAAFRAAWLAMARDACAGTDEHPRLSHAAERMRRTLAEHIEEL